MRTLSSRRGAFAEAAVNMGWFGWSGQLGVEPSDSGCGFSAQGGCVEGEIVSAAENGGFTPLLPMPSVPYCSENRGRVPPGADKFGTYFGLARYHIASTSRMLERTQFISTRREPFLR